MDICNRLNIKVKNKIARCVCPENHNNNDKKPSMGIDAINNRFKCFACGISGDIIELVKYSKNISFKEAVEWILGYNPYKNNNNEKTPERSRREDYISNMYNEPKEENKKINKVDNVKRFDVEPVNDINDTQDNKKNIYKDFLRLLIPAFEAKTALEYFEKRAINIDILSTYPVYFLEKESKSIIKSLKAKYNDDELIKSGILEWSTKTNSSYLFCYNHPIVFPFYIGEDIVYYQVRRLDDEVPKYKQIKRPIQVQYNWNIVEYGDKGDTIFITEGISDCLSLASLGYNNVIAVLGVNNFKDIWIKSLLKYNIVLAFDADTAGEQATKKIAMKFLEYGNIVKTIDKSNWSKINVKDINEYLINNKG